jgi:acyl-CoA thioesterase II
MAETARLAALLELDPVKGLDDVFQAVPLACPGRMYGGEAAARALAAARRTVPDDRRVHAVHASYLRAGDPALPLCLRVERLRDGRAFAARRVDVEQGGKLIFTMTLSFHAGGQAFAHQDPMPAVPLAEELPLLSRRTGGQWFWPDWVVDDPVVELRPVPGSCIDGGADDASRRAIWCRVPGDHGDDPALHECLWLYASDISLVSSIRLPHEPFDHKTWLMTSLNHTVWFHRPFLVDDWYLVVQRSPRAGGGRGLAEGQVFTGDGTLVSTIAQEGLATPVPDDVKR